MKVDTFTPEQIPVISAAWHVRPNRGGGLVYSFSHDVGKLVSLPFHLTVLLALCDGRRTMGAITALAAAITGIPEKALACGWTALFEAVEREGDFLGVYRGEACDITVPDSQRLIADMVASRPSAANHSRLDVPVSLLVLPTYACRTECIYCYSERPKLDRRNCLQPSRWVALFHEAARLGIDLVTFSGGDPLLYEGIEQLLEALAASGCKYLLPTKSRITAERARRLAGVLGGHGELQVSIDSFDDAIAGRMTGVAGYAADARFSIANLVAAGIPVRTNSVVTPINLGSVEPLVRELRELGVASANFTNYYRTFYRHRDELFLDEDQIAMLNMTVRRLAAELAWKDLRCNAASRDFSTPDPGREKAWKTRAACSGGFSSLAILPDGDVILCEQVPHAAPFVVGNVRSSGIAEVWGSEALLRFIMPERERFAGTACAMCDAFDECHRIFGRCFRDAFFSYGSAFAPPPSCPRAPAALRMA